MGTVEGQGTQAQRDAVPGANGGSDLFVDEVNLYTVRDTVHMYDEDLMASIE